MMAPSRSTESFEASSALECEGRARVCCLLLLLSLRIIPVETAGS